MRNLKPVQVLTPEGIFLLERVKMYLSTYNDTLPTENTTKIIVELTELINELKTEYERADKRSEILKGVSE